MKKNGVIMCLVFIAFFKKNPAFCDWHAEKGEIYRMICRNTRLELMLMTKKKEHLLEVVFFMPQANWTYLITAGHVLQPNLKNHLLIRFISMEGRKIFCFFN